jgi:ADP-ribose pyrophosphatase YjhB (NUDIX family)
MIETRSAARLVLVDDGGRVLLFLHVDGSGREFWATPGGGINPGESAESAAHREAAEELGTKDVEIQPLWTGHTDFAFADREISQDETFFLLKRHSTLFELEVERAHRSEGIQEVRWWTLSEIESSTDAIFPRDLVRKLRENLPQLRGEEWDSRPKPAG